jgi:hypothetical protein
MSVFENSTGANIVKKINTGGYYYEDHKQVEKLHMLG